MSDDLKREVLHLIEKHKVTAYDIEKNTELSAVGIQKIIDGKTKNPTGLSTLMGKLHEEQFIILTSCRLYIELWR